MTECRRSHRLEWDVQAVNATDDQEAEVIVLAEGGSQFGSKSIGDQRWRIAMARRRAQEARFLPCQTWLNHG